MPEQLRTSPDRPWYISVIFALVAVTLLLGGSFLYARLRSPFPFFGTAYPAAPLAPGFSGTDQNGQAYTFEPQGKTTALFFGFTHCPNICPLSLTYLSKLRSRLSPAQQQQFQVLLLSVDPARDTPQQLKAYTAFFGRALGVRVAEPQLAAVARQYGAAYSRAELPGAAAGDYQINHTTATYLIDRAGRLRLIWDYSQLPQLSRLQADLEEVMR